MRYPETHKEEVRKKLIESAARMLRAHGLSGVGIPALMREVGLTHGAFYVHFSSRDELVAEAVKLASQQITGSIEAPERSWNDAVQHYLHRVHRDHPEQGCALAALGSEAPRQDKSVREVFSQSAVNFVHRLDKKLHPKHSRREPHDDALVAASTMLGAIILSRLLGAHPLADRVLHAVTESLLNSE